MVRNHAVVAMDVSNYRSVSLGVFEVKGTPSVVCELTVENFEGEALVDLDVKSVRQLRLALTRAEKKMRSLLKEKS